MTTSATTWKARTSWLLTALLAVAWSVASTAQDDTTSEAPAEKSAEKSTEDKRGDDDASSDDQEADEPTREQLVARMDADDFGTRESAMRQLMADPELTAEEAGKLYRNAQSFEQQWRLEQVAKHLFVRSMLKKLESDETEGVLGVTIQGVPARHEDDRAGIRVMSTIPGLPAHAHLRTDDLIVRAEGKDIANASEPELIGAFRTRVLGKKQGETMKLGVLRDGKVVDVTLTLGRHADLLLLYSYGSDGQMELNEPYYSRWVQFRRQHMGIEPKETDESAVAPRFEAAPVPLRIVVPEDSR